MRKAIAAAIAASALVACGGFDIHREPARTPVNVLLVTIDTFRADRLGAGFTPALDRLAASGLTFTSARSAVPLTLPSHTTILTGLLPPAHGVRENGIDALSSTHPTIATLLKSAGYRTAAFVGAFVLDRRFGLAQGFDSYDDQIPRDPAAVERLEAERPASAVIDRALAWLESWTKDQGPRTDQEPRTKDQGPFFVWIHLYDPHAPYSPPPEFLARVRSGRARNADRPGSSLHPTPGSSPQSAPASSLQSAPASSLQPPASSEMYDGEIVYVDAQVGRLFDWLAAHALGASTLIVVAGDHGEGLGDHGEQTHGMLLYDSTLRVPLLMAAAAVTAARRNEPVTLADIAPTILHAISLTPPPEMKGRDLLQPPSLAGTSVPSGRDGGGDLYAETEYPKVAGWMPLQALTDGRWKLVRAGGGGELYDVRNDPNEQHNVVKTQAAVVSAMSSRLDAIRAGGSESKARTVSPEAVERLRTLGYVAASAAAAPRSNAPNPAEKTAEWTAFENALSALNARSREALPALKKLTDSNPDALVFQSTYARALTDAGDWNRALIVYRDTARRWPTDAMLLHDLAVAAREAATRAAPAAAAALRQEAARADHAAIALAPDSAIAHNGLGLLAIDEHRLEDAVAAFGRATALDATNASYWANLGNAQRATGDRTRAEHAYRRALEIDAVTADAANGLGVLLVEAQRSAEAVPWFERAIAAAPAFVEARLNLGIALQESGQVARAADAYRAVLGAPGRHDREKQAAAKLLASLGAAR